MADHRIRLLALWGWEALGSWALGSAPVALPDEECTSNNSGVDLSGRLINDQLLVLNHTACLSLVVYANNLIAELERPAFGRNWEGLEEGDEPLAIYNTASVELWHAGDRGRSLAGVEIDNFLSGAFKCWLLLALERRGGLGSLRRIMAYVGKTAKFGCNSYSC